jgi:glutamate carboxypeptidase
MPPVYRRENAATPVAVLGKAICQTQTGLLASASMAKLSIEKELLQWLRSRQGQMIATLETFVRAESPSTEKDIADTCARIIANEWRKRAVTVELLDQKHRGAHIRVGYAQNRSAKRGQLLVLGHYDTVYASGTLAKMPYRKRGGRIFGPGIFDMKAGIVQALFALDAIRNSGAQLRKNLVFLWTSDEEIGSESSRKLLESEARRSDAVFVLEPSLGAAGLLKTARKGVGDAEIVVHGRASHAGLAPEKGVNAIHEVALQLSRIQKWNDPRRGISVNAGLVSGGTRPNVIPDQAKAILDLRALEIADMKKIEHNLQRLRPILRGAKLEVHGGFSRPPLERKQSAALYERAKALGKRMGLSIGEGTAGGGSDGNLTAALGIPTLDGMGAVGDGAHSPDEHIFAKSLPERAALLGAMLLNS